MAVKINQEPYFCTSYDFISCSKWCYDFLPIFAKLFFGQLIVSFIISALCQSHKVNKDHLMLKYFSILDLKIIQQFDLTESLRIIWWNIVPSFPAPHKKIISQHSFSCELWYIPVV